MGVFGRLMALLLVWIYPVCSLLGVDKVSPLCCPPKTRRIDLLHDQWRTTLMLNGSIVRWRRAIVWMNKSDNDAASPSPPSPLLVKPPQQRRPHGQTRKPKYYWTQSRNLHREIAAFWRARGVQTLSGRPILVPNATLLRYYGRHDLRGALAQYDKRMLAHDVGMIQMPGKWQDAVRLPEMQDLLQHDPTLSAARPPCLTTSLLLPSHAAADKKIRWQHQPGRKPMHYWNRTSTIQELYRFVQQRRRAHHIPATYLPTAAQLRQAGRADLAAALVRQPDVYRAMASGMIAVRDWSYFEGQLRMLQLLQQYLDEHVDSDYSTFPKLKRLRGNVSYEPLYRLIHKYGGRHLVASRFDMARPERSWGPFSLTVAVRVLTWVRRDQLRRMPPLTRPVLAMPTAKQLLASEQPQRRRRNAAAATASSSPSDTCPTVHDTYEEGLWLHEHIEKCGGYENVARRLGLAFFD